MTDGSLSVTILHMLSTTERTAPTVLGFPTAGSASLNALRIRLALGHSGDAEFARRLRAAQLRAVTTERLRRL